ncbi:MAG: aspartate-semialdehyde dehydrogenase [Holosporales bacterium]|jgi:aspartate-semialdehyde dehydrogenase|nr:aspartate-semialdehyde dehydrogenase [Holosporales bacterium]
MSMLKDKKIIVVGATGKVGREMFLVLQELGLPSNAIFAAASCRSAGKMLTYLDKQIEVYDLEYIDFSKYDIALFSAGSEISKTFAPKAVQQGCIVIDNTSYFRMHEDVPLIVPEINFNDLKKYKNPNIIANPNCSTIQMVLALKPLHDAFGLKEVIVSTYQSVSGAGQKGIEELMDQTEQCLNNDNIEPVHFKKQIAFNIIPQIDDFTDSLYTKEELKMMNETRKILDLEHLDITATCVRVPVMIGHSISIFLCFETKVDIKIANKELNRFKGIELIEGMEYVTPIEIPGKNQVFISRVRKHPTLPNALSLWCVADNLRKGAALNAVQIANEL